MESFCGKNCETCPQRQALPCPGCMTWEPGSLSRSCEIAQCCAQNGHRQCVTCQFHEGCYKRQKREQMAASILRSRLIEEERASRITKRALEMGNWLWILFWLLITSLICSLVTNVGLFPIFPVLQWLIAVISLGIYLAHGLILIRLGRVSRHYKISGWCSLGRMLLTAATLLLSLIPGIINVLNSLRFAAFPGRSGIDRCRRVPLFPRPYGRAVRLRKRAEGEMGEALELVPHLSCPDPGRNHPGVDHPRSRSFGNPYRFHRHPRFVCSGDDLSLSDRDILPVLSAANRTDTSFPHALRPSLRDTAWSVPRFLSSAVSLLTGCVRHDCY